VKLTLRADGTAHPDEVWSRYLHPSRWPEWSPQIRRVDVDGDRLVPGSVGTVRGPLDVGVPFRVLEVDPDSVIRSWSWRVTVGPISLRLEHAVIPLDRAGSTDPDVYRTATTLGIHGPAPVVVAYAPLAQLALAKLVRR
jgi:hypothetical protein